MAAPGTPTPENDLPVTAEGSTGTTDPPLFSDAFGQVCRQVGQLVRAVAHLGRARVRPFWIVPRHPLWVWYVWLPVCLVFQINKVVIEKENTTRSAIRRLESAAKLYKTEKGAWPVGQTEDVLVLLMKRKGKNGQRIVPRLKEIPVDAWGKLLRYEYPAKKPDKPLDKPLIWSSGPDKQEGTDDDITNINAPR